MALRSVPRLGTTLVLGAGLALVITGCASSTKVGGNLGNGANGKASGGANAFDASPTASSSAAPAATSFGGGSPSAAATSAAPKTAVAVATKTAAVATQKATAAAVATAASKKPVVVKTTAKAVATAKASASTQATAGGTSTSSLMPFAVGIYPDGDAGHTPLMPVNSSVYGGQSVVFTNYDTVAHSVQAQDGEFSSGPIAPNATYTYVAETTSNETIDYQDGTRPYDDGEVVVTQS